MTVELKKGYVIDSFYDKNTRSYVTTLRDNEGNQIRDAYYSGNMTDRDADVQFIKEFFYKYMYPEDKTNEYEEPEEVVEVEEDEIVEESLESKIAETKRKTKKAKLPALSTLSPIMPDGAAGIATFNSGVGLSEEYLDRDELIYRIGRMGFKYKYDKYTDEQLYKIYQERLKTLEKRRKQKEEKHKKQRSLDRVIDKLEQVDYDEDSDTYSDGNYYKDGIEFESEEAAREYFGESMENKFYLNDMHEAWDIEECYESSDKKIINESLNESVFDKINITYTKSGYGGFTTDGEAISDIDEYIKRFDKVLGNPNTRYVVALLKSTISSSNYFAIVQTDDLEAADYVAKRWLNDQKPAQEWQDRHCYAMIIDLEERKEIASGDVWVDSEGNITKGWKQYSLITESINESLKRIERKAFNESSKVYDFEALYESVKNNLDANDIKKLGNFLNKADSAEDVATYIKGLLTEDLNNKLMDIAQEIENAAQDDGVWCAIYDTIPGSISFLVEGDWKWGHLRFEHIAGAILQSHGLNYESFEDEVGDSDTDDYESIHTFNIDKSPMDESLNEAWNRIESDYGRTIYYNRDWYKDDKDFFDSDEVVYIQPSNGKFTAILSKSGNYGAKQKSFNSFEEAYRFAEYLYKKYIENDSSLNEAHIEEQQGYSVEDVTKDLIEKSNEVGFILDESVTPIKDNMFGGKHLQVINPNLVFPIEEAEGDEELAYQLMVDDLKEVTEVLDEFDDSLGRSGYVTFNFGANKDNVITGGIDIRIR